MDFAALMSAQIAKAAPAPKKTSTDDDKPAKKYIKNSEAEAARLAAYKADQAAIAAEREYKTAAKRKREDDAAVEAKAREERRARLAEESRARREEAEREEERAKRKKLGLPELIEKNEEDGEEDEDEEDAVDDETLRQRLREMGHPVVLFGETQAQRKRRWKRLATVVTAGPIPTTLVLVEGKDMKLDGTVPADKAGRKYLYRQLASYFTMVLREWEAALANEAAEAGGDPAAVGASAMSALLQSKEQLKPLFRKFEKGDLEDSILEPIVEIVKAAQERRYVAANDGYLRLSIGKAAWPIGVTMVGIHERSAREKLHNGERGHVMGDEVTRKYLQSIKRCLTFAQVRWPSEDLRHAMG